MLQARNLVPLQGCLKLVRGGHGRRSPYPFPDAPFLGPPAKGKTVQDGPDCRMQSPLDQPFVPPALPTPFWGGKRNCMGLGLSATPEGPATLPPWSSYLAIIWAPEKYRWPWLTELFFRFEPAPLFESDPAGGRKALSESPAGPPGWEKLPGRAVPARPAHSPCRRPSSSQPCIRRSCWRQEPEPASLGCPRSLGGGSVDPARA